MLLVLLLDAFRPDYLERTPFLRGLSARGALGRFQEPFGFCPRAGYFGGLTPGEAGYAFALWRDPELSPFGAARLVPADRNLSARGRGFVRDLVAREARAAATPFARAYVHPLEIPLETLAEFDVPEKYAPWDPRAGYRSIFHELTEQGRAWLYAAWPWPGDFRPRDDGEVVRGLLERITPRHDFVFAQFSELDAAGHEHGPGSRAVVAALERTDVRVRRLLKGLEEQGHRADVILFGDHGMVSVVRSIDVAARLPSTADYSYFLDSTAARFWYRHAAAQEQVRAALADFYGLRRLDDADRVRFGLTGLDPRNGDDIFLAAPGVVISPSFFHRAGLEPLGMHGYDPAEPDNQGLFLATGPSFSAATDAGVVEAADLHALSRRLLGLGLLGLECGPVAFQPPPGESEAARTIPDGHLAAVRAAIEELDPGPRKTIVLAGSFGRGEGMLLENGGAQRPLNDYDVLVFSATPVAAAAVAETRRRLAQELALPYVDLSWFPPEWAEDPEPSLFRFDLRYGSRVMAGDAAFLDRLPQRAANDIAPGELRRLLCNRAAGMLLALTPYGTREFLWIQVMKIGVAVADHYLCTWGSYHPRYATRRRRFATLGRAAGLDSGVLAAVDACFAFRVRPEAALPRHPREVWRGLAAAWASATAERLTGAPGDVQTAVRTYLDAGAGPAETARALAAGLLGALDENLYEVPARIARFREIAGSDWAAAPAFEALRARVTAEWEERCH